MNWLLLRGLIREQRHWGHFLVEMKAAFPNSHIITLDYPGIGTEIHRISPTGVDRIMNDIRERFLVQKLKLSTGSQTKEWGVFGVSLGGMVVLKWAELFPMDFSHYAVANTSASNYAKPWERMRLKNLSTFSRITLTNSNQGREENILKMTTKLSPSRIKEIAGFQTQYSLPKGKFIETATRQLISAIGFKLNVQAIREHNLKIITFVSLNDTLVYHTCSERIAKAINSSLLVNEFADHDITMDASNWVAQSLKKWSSNYGAINEKSPLPHE